MPRYALIADDLTGATDAGAAFARAGFSVDVALTARALPGLHAEVVAVTTNSRHDSPARARAKVRRACRALRTCGRELIYKKLDSTVQGNIVAEIEAARIAAGFDAALVCPANPGQGRVVRDSILTVRGQDYGSLPDRFRAQGARNLEAICLPLNLRQARAAVDADARLVVADAAQDRDLEILVRAALGASRRILLAGSAGLAAALAKVLRPRRALSTKEAARGSERQPGRLPVLVLCGTRNPLTLDQVDALLKGESSERWEWADCTCAKLRSAFGKDRHGVVHVPVHLVPEAELTRGLRQYEGLLVEKRLGGLLLTGGDTALLVCRSLKMRSLALQGEILPGLAWGYARGGLADGLIVCTKPGGFGDLSSLCEAVQFLTAN